MGEFRVVRNSRGRFNIRGQRNVEVDLGENDPEQFAVIEKDLEPNLPSTFDGVPIRWIAAFGVRHIKLDKNLGDYANIKYIVTLDAIPKGSRLFIYYGGEIHERTFTTKGNRTRVELEIGDPPIGFGP